MFYFFFFIILLIQYIELVHIYENYIRIKIHHGNKSLRKFLDTEEICIDLKSRAYQTEYLDIFDKYILKNLPINLIELKLIFFITKINCQRI